MIIKIFDNVAYEIVEKITRNLLPILVTFQFLKCSVDINQRTP